MSAQKIIEVGLSQDHLASLVKAKPVNAVSELIWNSLDAEATEVRVNLNYLSDTLLQTITVQDNGLGIHPDLLNTTLSEVGNSWKKTANISQNKKRTLHGKQGKGRFQPFALGTLVEWDTAYKEKGQLYEFHLLANYADIKNFRFYDPIKSEKGETGTTVTVSNISKTFSSLEDDHAQQRFTEEFALYLTQYKDVSIFYQGERLDPEKAWLSTHDESLDDLEIDGEKYTVDVTLIEWDSSQERGIFLCSSDGIKLEEIPKEESRYQAKDKTFTAYIKSPYFEELQKKGELELNVLKPEILDLVDKTKDVIRKYYRSLIAKSASARVKQWKASNIYPYKNEPSGVIEEAERQLFDMLAITVDQNLDGFSSSRKDHQRFTLELIRQSLERNPDNLQLILKEVLNLKKEDQDDLASLLKNEHTSLPSVIKAARTVADRMDFLHLLETLIYVPENKQKLKERSQLHKMLEKEIWIFGEEYSLGVSDKSLTAILERHRKLTGMDEQGDDFDKSEVTDIEGRRRIIDLMLSRRIPQNREEDRRHLVIELKAPKQKVNRKVIEQIEDYARAVVADERFKTGSADVKWDFIAISNDFDANAEARAKGGKQYGLIEDRPDENYRIWIMRWSQIIDACRARYALFQKQLKYEADEDTSKEYREKKHEEIFNIECTTQNTQS